MSWPWTGMITWPAPLMRGSLPPRFFFFAGTEAICVSTARWTNSLIVVPCSAATAFIRRKTGSGSFDGGAHKSIFPHSHISLIF